MVVFMVSGLWHGANWTFIFWGAYHGLLVCFYKLTKGLLPTLSHREGVIASLEGETNGRWPKWKAIKGTKYLNTIIVFIFVTIGWQVFRCDSFGQFVGLWERMFTGFGPIFKSWALMGFIPIGILMLKELKDEEGWNIHLLHSKKLWVQIVSFALIAVFILYFGELEGGSFIYFQF